MYHYLKKVYHFSFVLVFFDSLHQSRIFWKIPIFVQNLQKFDSLPHFFRKKCSFGPIWAILVRILGFSGPCYGAFGEVLGGLAA